MRNIIATDQQSIVRALNTMKMEPAMQLSGVATLVSGTVDVSVPGIRADTQVIPVRKTQGSSPGHLSWAVTENTKFTITSSSGSDDADIAWYTVDARTQ